MLGHGRLEEAEAWLGRAERTLRVESEPAAGLVLRIGRGSLELTRGRPHAALRAFRSAEELGQLLVVPHALALGMRGYLLHSLIRAGQTGRAERAIAELDEQSRKSGEIRICLAALRLAQHDPEAATVTLAPVLNRAAPVALLHWRVQAFLLEAIARDALGDTHSAQSALDQALELAEPDGLLNPFLVHPATGLLERLRHQTSHASLIAEILDRLAGASPTYPAESEPVPEALSDSEKRILRYLPTHLSAPEIAGELHLSMHTVKSHMRHLYAKLGTHQRADTVERARTLGLLAPSSRQH